MTTLAASKPRGVAAICPGTGKRAIGARQGATTGCEVCGRTVTLPERSCDIPPHQRLYADPMLCPECGELPDWDIIGRGAYEFRCRSCEMSVAAGPTRRDAIDAWNEAVERYHRFEVAL